MSQLISGVAVLEADSAKRIATRYFHPSLTDREKQVIFEKQLFTKISKSLPNFSQISAPADKGKEGGKVVNNEGSNEIVLVDDFVIIVRLVNDLIICVIGNSSFNDLILNEFTNTIFESLKLILNPINKKNCFKKLDQIFLIIDESIENGVILEFDAHHIVSRIQMNVEDSPIATPPGAAGSAGGPSVISTQAVTAALQGLTRGDTETAKSLFQSATQTFGSFFSR